MMKEPEIMLFGTNILLPENGRAAAGGGEYSAESCVESGGGGGVDCGRCFKNGKGDVDDDDREKQEQFDEEQQEEEQQCETTEQDKDRNPGPTDESHDNPSSDSDNNTPKTPSTEDVENHPKLENEQTSAEPKALKKPDKILPCPRCNSSDTKFCYYNNYNVKQPRHFCKSCQRYWTAGGTMRNVPVGAGRRKHKNYASHFRRVTISEPLHAGSSTADGFCHVKLKPNGGVLSFGPDSPMTSNMTIAKNGVVNCENGPQRPAMQNVINGLGSQLVSWPFHPAVYPPGYPIQYYYTPPVWNCNVPFLSVQSPTANQTAISSGPTSPLGKHSRNGELLNTNNISDGNEPRNSGSSIVVPKTLRIDDPEEAAKSSIWSTLGIEYDSFSLLKALQPKGNEKRSTIASSSLLQANPAALSRSISFHERV